jgi:flavin reductase (DIM6/NTAB) family NADH-FMN oxidoreductase RutF
MIEECPVNIECKLVKTIAIDGDHDIFFGEIIQTYCKEEGIKEGRPDLELIQPILFTFGNNKYWKTGGFLASAWNAGREFTP